MANRCPLTLKVLFNVLVAMSALGPLQAIDSLLTTSQRRIVFRLLWAALQIAHQHRHHLTWAAALPHHMTSVLATTWNLEMDGFSDIYNNNFSVFVIDPHSQFSFLAQHVDIFQTLRHQPTTVSALCNPPFSSSLISCFLAHVEQRCLHQCQPTNIVYIGPAHAGLKHLFHLNIAAQLAHFPAHSLPFVHALNGTMPGFPRPLELWWLGNIPWPDTRLIIKSLIMLRQRYPLTISHHVYEREPCKITRQVHHQRNLDHLLSLQTSCNDF